MENMEDNLKPFLKDLADNVLDFLYELQCEWNWKRNCGYPKPEEDYKELVVTIERFKKAIGK